MLAAVVWAAVLCPLGREEPFKRSEYAAVVSAIERGTLVPDGAGAVPLPTASAGLSVTGRAYVTAAPRGGLIVFFPSWLGRQALLNPLQMDDAWVEGYLYDPSSTGGGCITGPAYAAPWRARRDRGTTTVCVNPDRRIGDRWFHVSQFS